MPDQEVDWAEDEVPLCSPDDHWKTDPGLHANQVEDETELRSSRSLVFRMAGAEGLEALPAELRCIVVDGARVAGDPPQGAVPVATPPAWYDKDLFLEGQRVANLYYAGLAEAEMLFLFLLFAHRAGMDPLIATGRSDSPETAGRRYMSTALRVLAWYSSDPFDPGSDCHRHLQAVRRLHVQVRRMCHQASPEELARKFTIGKEQPRPLTCPLAPLSLFRDLQCPVAMEVDVDRLRRPFLTQAEMAMTQFAFFGLFILQPHLFGAPYISRRELEALVHLWAVLGHCLGIKDHFNWCLGGLDTVLRRSEQSIRIINVPFLRGVGPEWEHMSRCMVDGMRFHMPLCSFEANLAYLTTDVLHLPVAPRLSWKHTLELWRLRIFLNYLPRVLPAVTGWLSAGLQRLLRSKKLKAVG